MVDTRLPLMTQPLDTATPARQANQDSQANALNHEQILSAHYQNMDNREKARLSSVISGAVQLKPFLDNQDYDGAHEFLMRRRNSIQQRMGGGENVDTEDTDAAIEMLRKGNVEELNSTIGGLMAAGQVYGILSNKDMPANIQEWQQFNRMTPEQQQQYLTMKRANPAVNLGGSQIIPNPVNPAGPAMAQFEVTPKPEEDPEFKRQQAQAVAEGTATGTRNAANEKKEFDAVANQNYIREALKVLPATTSGGAATIAKGVGQFAGVSTDSSKADRKMELLANKLVGTIPRFEGPQSNMDVQLYKDAAGDLANTRLPREDREAAAQMMLDLLAEYGGTGTGNNNPTPVTGGRITVTNGRETFEIDEADLPAAQAEGFTRQ